MTGIGHAFGAATRRRDAAAMIIEAPKTATTFDFYFSRATGPPTTITSTAVIDVSAITVSSTTGFSAGTYVCVFSGVAQQHARYYCGEAVSVAGSVISLDTPIDYAFEVGSLVFPMTRDLNVDGSVTRQEFIVQAGPSETDLVVDITRIMISMYTASAVDLSKFGDQPPLTNGLVLRKVDGIYRNLWNVKTNAEFGALAYDWTPYTSTNPSQGTDGFLCRYTLNGPSKHDAVVRLEPGDQLQLLVQDDLSGIDYLRIIAAGRESPR